MVSTQSGFVDWLRSYDLEQFAEYFVSQEINDVNDLGELTKVLSCSHVPSLQLGCYFYEYFRNKQPNDAPSPSFRVNYKSVSKLPN